MTTPTKAIPLTEDIDNKEFAACVGIPATIVSDHEEMFKSLRIKAMRLARTHVKIETMPSSESKLVAMLQETVLPHIKAKSDEVRTEYLTVYYDVRDSGETATAPHLRYMSYRSEHWKMCARSTLKIFDSEPKEIPEHVCFAVTDAFKHGNKSAFMAPFADRSGDKDRPFRRFDKTVNLMFDCDQMLERRGCVREFDITQIEHLHLITQNALNIEARSLMHFKVPLEPTRHELR